MKRYLIAMIVCALAVTDLSAAGPKKVKRHLGGIEGEFIVVLNEKTPKTAIDGLSRSLAASYGLKVETVWIYSLRGFLVRGDEAAIARMAEDPRIDYVEQNVNTRMPEIKEEAPPADATAPISSTQYAWFNDPVAGWQYLWFLDRLDETSYALRDGTHNMCTEGRSVTAYMIDTAIWAHHPQFETPTRVVRQIDFSNDHVVDPAHPTWSNETQDGCPNSPNVWHGTATASNLAGTQIGSAKTQIVSLKVFGCDFSNNTADFIDALEWIANPSWNPYRNQPGVINHSGYVPIWDGNFTAYSDAVDRTVRDINMPFFSSADNWGTDACRFSPKDRAYTNTNHNGTVFAVGGTSTSGVETDNNDYRWRTFNPDGSVRIGVESGSNGGGCISVYAPANQIYSARNDRNAASPYGWASGTSFASPITAGLAARYMERQRNITGVTPSYTQVYDFLLSQATTPVLEMQTTGYWVCAQQFANGGFNSIAYQNNPGTCPNGYTGPYQFNSVGNTSNARMLYWNEGDCW